jgi:hypothetical protein
MTTYDKLFESYKAIAGGCPDSEIDSILSTLAYYLDIEFDEASLGIRDELLFLGNVMHFCADSIASPKPLAPTDLLHRPDSIL